MKEVGFAGVAGVATGVAWQPPPPPPSSFTFSGVAGVATGVAWQPPPPPTSFTFAAGFPAFFAARCVAAGYYSWLYLLRGFYLPVHLRIDA